MDNRFEKVCPNCGHCPTCGRARQAITWPVYPWPTYPPYSPWWGVYPPTYGGGFTITSTDVQVTGQAFNVGTTVALCA